MTHDAGLVPVKGSGEGRRNGEKVPDCRTVSKNFIQADGKSMSRSCPSEESPMGSSGSDLEPAGLCLWQGVAQGMCGLGVNTVKCQKQWKLRLSVNSALCGRRSQWCNSMMAQQAERAREEVQRKCGGEVSLESQAGARS